MNHPNVILIMTDQQRYDTIGALGFPHMQTPQLDRLVREGVSFDNCFCASPSCMPSRASFFSARYPHQTGVYSNAGSWDHSWVEQFRDAGYHTISVGKMHTKPVTVPCGFDQRIIVENPDRPFNFDSPHGVFYDDWDKFLNGSGVRKPSRVTYRDEDPLYDEALGAFVWPLDEKYHPDVFVRHSATWLLEQRTASNPLFLQVGFPGPHPPYSPAQRFIEQYDDTLFDDAPVTQDELDGQPPPHATYRRSMIDGNHDAVRWHERPTPEQLRRLRQYYAAYNTMLDEQIGCLLDVLQQKGYLDDAIVVFTSDHGDCIGDHGHIQKWTMYDEVTRVPMLVWSPSRLPQGQRHTALIQQMDVVPMLFELAGLTLEGPHAARSALPLVQGDDAIRDAVFSEHGRSNQIPDIDFMTMIRTDDWKLVHYLNQPWGELYDLKNDPQEFHNLWNDPTHADTRDTLAQQIDVWRGQLALRNGKGFS